MHTTRATRTRAAALGLLLLTACGQGLGRQPSSQSAAIPPSTPTSTPTVSEAASGQVHADSATTPTTDPTDTTVPTTEPAPRPRPLPRPAAEPRVTVPTLPAATIDGMPAVLRRIGGCESSGYPEGPLRWTQKELTGASTASGAFQMLDSTYRGWALTYGAGTDALDYARAMYAPPATQLTIAIRAHAAEGTQPWRESRGCWG